MVGDKAFKCRNINGVINLISRAHRHTRMRAHPATNCRKGIIPENHLQSFFKPAPGDQFNICLSILMQAAGCLAGWHPFTGNGIRVRYRLRKWPVNGFAGSQAFVKFGGYIHRTDLHTFTTAGACFFVYKSSLLFNFHLKIANITIHAFHLRISHEFYIWMCGYLGHFRGQDTSRAIQGGKSFIEFCHMATDGRFAFDQINLFPGIGHRKSGLYSSDSSTNDHGIRMNRH